MNTTGETIVRKPGNTSEFGDISGPENASKSENASERVTSGKVTSGKGAITSNATDTTDTTAPVVFDVAVIGAGIVGSAVARELAAYELSVALLDARDDVGDGTSKANTAILHTGFDATPGTLEARLVREGYRLLSDYAARTGIPVERTGALLVAWNAEELDALPGLREKAERNGYGETEIVGPDEVYRQLPHLGEGALGGLTVPDESIVCTWTTNLALATDAVGRGVTLLLNRAVLSAEDLGDSTVLRTSGGDVNARWVVNAAGLGADVVDRLFGHDRFTVTPRRGELLVYDKFARTLVDKIILPVPGPWGKGVLISPTVYGNVLLGPTAEDIADRTDTGTSEGGLEFLLGRGERLMPGLLREEVTATYAGLRAASDHPDYLIEADPGRRYVLVGGIRSTGLTAGIAIAEHVAELARDAGLTLVPRENLPEPPRMPNLGEAYPRPYQDAARIAADPAYGKVVCFCERVTYGEIRDALRSPIPPAGLEGLRRRTRALNGRCQGFFCGAEVGRLLAGKGGNTRDVAGEGARDGGIKGEGEGTHESAGEGEGTRESAGEGEGTREGEVEGEGTREGEVEGEGEGEKTAGRRHASLEPLR